MLNSVIIGGDADLVRYLRQVCAEFTDIGVYKILSTSARRYEIVATLNGYSPDVVFLDISDLDSPESMSFVCLQELTQSSRTAVVPFSKQARKPDRKEDGAAGLGSPLTPPFNAEQLERAVHQAMQRGRPAASSYKVMAFLPAKPGAGTSTLAVNIAGVSANEFQQRTLLIEADLHCGALAYMLNLQTAGCGGDTIWNPRLLEENQWDSLVSQSNGIDILPACVSPQSLRHSRWDFCRLLKFARERYEVVIVDLPAVIDEITETLLPEADKVVMVSTPEVPSLCMARRRVWELETREVRLQHLQLLVNRHQEDDFEPREMAAIAQHEVSAVLPEDAPAIKSASRRSGLLSGDGPLVEGVVTFATELLGLKHPRAAKPGGILNRIIRRAFRPQPAHGFGASIPTQLEARSGYTNSGGRRQLDRR